MSDCSREQELRALATTWREQAKGSTSFAAAAALVSMADCYERQADRLGAVGVLLPPSKAR